MSQENIRIIDAITNSLTYSKTIGRTAKVLEMVSGWQYCPDGIGCCQKLRWGTEQLYVVPFIIKYITQYSKLFVLKKWIAQITEKLWLSNNPLEIQLPLHTSLFD